MVKNLPANSGNARAGIIKAFGRPVEVGGGIRSPEALAAVIEAGAARAIIGSAALDNPEFLSASVELYGDKIAVGIDARDGFVQTKGWVETTAVKATDLAAAVAAAGVKTIIYTDTATDGMLGGPNLAQMAAICDAAPGCDITASGGVSSVYDIANLKALHLDSSTGSRFRPGVQRAACHILQGRAGGQDRKSTRLNSSHTLASRMPSSA